MFRPQLESFSPLHILCPNYWNAFGFLIFSKLVSIFRSLQKVFSLLKIYFCLTFSGWLLLAIQISVKHQCKYQIPSLTSQIVVATQMISIELLYFNSLSSTYNYLVFLKYLCILFLLTVSPY